MREGAWSLEAQTIYPSKTLPSHTSMLTGVPPEQHGVTWNSDKTDVHGVVERADGVRGGEAGGLSDRGVLQQVEVPAPPEAGHAGPLRRRPDRAGRTCWPRRRCEDVVSYLKFERPNLLFVHIGEPDYAGHTVGWMSAIYGWAVRRADAAVGEVLAAADGRTAAATTRWW